MAFIFLRASCDVNAGCHILGCERGKCFIPLLPFGGENILEEDPSNQTAGKMFASTAMSLISLQFANFAASHAYARIEKERPGPYQGHAKSAKINLESALSHFSWKNLS